MRRTSIGTSHVHRIPHHVRDDAYAPRVGAEQEELNHIFRKNESRLFFTEALDKANNARLAWLKIDLPVG
jgi:hypothetical protein